MQLRTILVTLASLTFLATSTAGYLYYSALRESALNESYTQAISYMEVIKDRVSSLLSDNLKSAKALAGLIELQQALEVSDEASLSIANTVLTRFRDAMNVDFCYLMDREGNTLASANPKILAYQTEESPSSSYSPYFRKAVHGTPAIYMEAGIASKKRWIYFSYPVYGDMRASPNGVVVIKASIEPIEREFRQLYNGVILLTDPRGIVFVSTREDWLYNSLWKTSIEEGSYGAQVLPLCTSQYCWTGLERRGSNVAVDNAGNKYLIRQAAIHGYPGWNIVCLTSLSEASRKLADPLIKITGSLILALCAFIGISVLFLYRKASHDIVRRRKAEEALQKSEEWYRGIVEDQTELISRFSPDGKLTFVNGAYCRFFDEDQEELLGRKFWHHVHEDDQQELRKHISLLSPENPVGVIEHRVVKFTGEIRWQQRTDRAVSNNGRVIEFQSVGRDITEQKQTEEALVESEKQLRFLSSQLLSAQEEERKRIAGELHDSISSSLSAIKYSLESTAARMPQTAAAPQAFKDHIAMVQKTIEEVRRIMTDLRPSMLDDLGIVTTLAWFCREFQSVYSAIRVQEQIAISEDEIPENLKIIIFRIVQEAFHNIAKYSKAETAELSLVKRNGRIELVVRDDGIGFDLKAVLGRNNHKRGLGLTSMKERAELSGGTFVIKSTLGEETRIYASWPLSTPEDGIVLPRSVERS